MLQSERISKYVFPLQCVAGNSDWNAGVFTGLSMYICLFAQTLVYCFWNQFIQNSGKRKKRTRTCLLHRFKCHIFFFVVVIVELHFVCNFLTEIYSISDFDPKSVFSALFFFVFGHFPIYSEKGIEREQSIALKVFEMRKVLFSLFVYLDVLLDVLPCLSVCPSLSFTVTISISLCQANLSFLYLLFISMSLPILLPCLSVPLSLPIYLASLLFFLFFLVCPSQCPSVSEMLTCLSPFLSFALFCPPFVSICP